MASKKVSNRVKFEVGEKVLCYEPDLAKTKVLYDSKVVKVECKKDDQGRKIYEFLIHFQGWNSTWDRYVTDEFILKDTEENRKLQKKLADEAQLTPGGHLYKKERKGRRGQRSETKATNAELSEDSAEETPIEEDEEILVPNDTIFLPKRKFPDLSFPENLKCYSGYGSYLVKDKNALIKLPCQPNIVTLLESYLKYFARTHCSDNNVPQKGRKQEVFDKTQIEKRFNICVEVLDGLRICFNNFLFKRLLINENEQVQYHEAIKMSLEPPKPYTDKPTENGDQPDHQDNVPNGEEMEDVHGRPEYAHSIVSQTISQTSQRTCSDCSLTKSQCSKLTFYKVRDEHVSKADKWKAVPDSLYYEEIKEPSLIYGAYHLLRLLINMPKILKYTDVTQEKLSAIYSVCNGLLSYLSTQQHLFVKEQFVDIAAKERESNKTVKPSEEPVKSRRKGRH